MAFCGAYGTRNRLVACVAKRSKNPDPEGTGESDMQQKKPPKGWLSAVRTGLEPDLHLMA